MLAIKGGRILSMDQAGIIDGGVILVEGKRFIRWARRLGFRRLHGY